MVDPKNSKDKKFLQWRFEKNPTDYFTVYKENQYFIILPFY